MAKQQGFTLLELLLAMAIFAMISLAGFTIFNTVLNSEESARLKMDRLNNIQTTFLLMERDFGQLARRHVRVDGYESSNAYIHSQSDGFSDEGNAIAFVRHGWTNPNMVLPRSELQSVAYRVKDDTLERVHFLFVDPVLGEEPKVRPLIDGVEEIAFEYFVDKKWQKELPSSKLPTGVAVEITLSDMGEIRRQFLVAGDTGDPSRFNSLGNNSGNSGNSGNAGNGSGSGEKNDEDGN